MDVLCNRSVTCAKMRRKQDALADAEEAMKCDATFVKGYLRRASANEALENWEEAVRDYEKVCDALKIPRSVCGAGTCPCKMSSLPAAIYSNKIIHWMLARLHQSPANRSH